MFAHQNAPVFLGVVVIDNSTGMIDKRGKVVAAALSLVPQSNPEDELFVGDFNDEAFVELRLESVAARDTRDWYSSPNGQKSSPVTE